MRVDLVRRADPAVAHDGGAGHVVQSSQFRMVAGGVAGGVGYVLMAGPTRSGPGTSACAHTLPSGAVPRRRGTPGHRRYAVAFDVGDGWSARAPGGIGMARGHTPVLRRVRYMPLPSRRAAFDALGRSLDLTFRQVLGLPHSTRMIEPARRAWVHLPVRPAVRWRMQSRRRIHADARCRGLLAMRSAAWSGKRKWRVAARHAGRWRCP